MRAYIAITDRNWFSLLSSLPQPEEVNFWRPSDSHFRALNPGELFLFKLHSPDNYIVGGGFYAHFTSLPISIAWESFGILNGARTLTEMRTRVEKYRRQDKVLKTDYHIGCLLLEQPFFLPRNRWISPPSDWKPNIEQGRIYDLSIEPGLSLWSKLQSAMSQELTVHESTPQYGQPILSMPRLGQGSFRILVIDAYERRCSITNERTLPALDAAHIKPYSESGKHVVRNGVLLRRDLHALFDKGYITITPSLTLEVSRRIREEFENGKDYYRLHGTTIRPPTNPMDRPSPEYLDWHNIHVYRG